MVLTWSIQCGKLVVSRPHKTMFLATHQPNTTTTHQAHKPGSEMRKAEPQGGESVGGAEHQREGDKQEKRPPLGGQVADNIIYRQVRM